MTLFQAFVLALVQGITEFLPISSTAHLVLVPYVLGWPAHSLTFDVATNLATLIAAVVFLRRELVAEARAAWAARPTRERPGLLAAAAVGTIPVGLAGLLFHDFFATTAREPWIIGAASIVFGLVLLAADRRPAASRPLAALSWLDALVIGVAQAVALIPGTSRSGITMTAGLTRSFSRADAARFSFWLAIPVGLLAAAKDVWDWLRGGAVDVELAPLALGFVVAGISAYAVMGWLLRWLARQTMTVFVVYRIVLGLAIVGIYLSR